MFDSLDDQMKRDAQKETSSSERYMKYAVVAVAYILIFGGVFLGTYYFD